MSRPIPSKRLAVVTAALILAGALAGCGKVGQLEPAQPLFGHKTAGASAPVPAQAPSRPVETVDPRDRPGDLQVPPPPGQSSPQ